MTIEDKLVPKGAMRFIDKGCHATALSSQGEDGQDRSQMDMMVYSGGVIKNHWYWDDLLIDLEGMKAGKSKYPVLEDHETSRKIAFSGKPIVKDGSLRLNPENTVFVDTEVSKEFQTLSKQGFPFQSSVRVNPRRVERIAEGSEAMANGQVLKGPASIFREWDYIEGSVCVFGWDNQTSASAFSKDIVQLDYELMLSKTKDIETPSQEETTIMNLDQFKKDHPELFAEVVKTATDQATASFAQEKTGLTSTIDALTVKLTESDTQIKELQKKDSIRAEKEMFAEAESIWAVKLSASEIPERMFSKVKKNVDHNAFVKDDVLDKAAFATAVDNELKDWADFKSVQGSSVQGQGFSLKDVEGQTATTAENIKLADSLFALTGQTAAK
jgi:hypothetical protein